MARHDRAASGANRRVGVVPVVAAGAGIILLLVALLTWTATRRAVDESAFTKVSLDALRSPAGQRLIADELNQRVQDGARQRGISLPQNVTAEMVPQAVATTVNSPQFAPLLTPTIENAHRQLLDDPQRGVVIELEPLREIVTSAEPQVAPLLPSGQFGRLAFTPDTTALDNAARAVGVARTLPTVAGSVGVILIFVSLVVGRRRRFARWIGIALILVAAACWALRLAGPRLAEAVVSAPTERDLATDVAVDLLGGWWAAALVALLPGVLLTAVGRRR